MKKKISNFMVFIGLFFMTILYSPLIIGILQVFHINISNMSSTIKCIFLILIDITFVFILYFIYRKEINKEFSNYINNFKKNISFGFIFWLIGLALMIISNVIIQFIYPEPASNEEAVQQSLKLLPLYTIFSSCIYAPFVEEIIFRKSLDKVFKNNIIFIVLSGLLFGLVHQLSQTTFDAYQLLYIIPYGLFGCVFAYMYRKTNTIFTSITFHLIHNSVMVFLSLYVGGIF